MYKAGISYTDFGKLNMIQIRHIAKAYSEKVEDDFRKSDVIAFIQGRYVVEALLCTVGNMLGGKNAKFTYPDKAYTMQNEEEHLSEEEIQRQREQFIAMMQVMEKNFKNNKSKEEKANGNER